METWAADFASNRIRIILALFIAQTACVASSAEMAGTYSSLSYNEEGGDLLGYEVRVIPTNQGNKALVQVAEGDAGMVYLVDVAERNGEVFFDVTLASKMVGQFRGTITKAGLNGVISFPSGVSERIQLKRQISYWERD